MNINAEVKKSFWCLNWVTNFTDLSWSPSWTLGALFVAVVQVIGLRLWSVCPWMMFPGFQCRAKGVLHYQESVFSARYQLNKILSIPDGDGWECSGL